MTRLYVVYDSRCGLCRRIRDWVAGEPAWWQLRPIAAGSAEARKLFPALDPGELAVIASDGRYWKGDHAWIVVLWALKRYRGWAKRLARPGLLPLARQAFAAVSGHRESIGWWMGLRSTEETARNLKSVVVPGCDV